MMDATPDDSVQEVVRDYRDRIAYAYHRPDGGQAEAIQHGWNHTSGDIVTWLNADDLYFPGALAAVEEALRLHSDVDVVYDHAVNLDQDGAFCSYFPVTPDDPQRVHRENVICQPACFVRRSAMERVGGLNTELHYVMDWDF